MFKLNGSIKKFTQIIILKNDLVKNSKFVRKYSILLACSLFIIGVIIGVVIELYIN